MPDLKISEFEERTSLQGSEDVGAADAGLNVRFKVATLRLYLNEVWGEYAGFIKTAERTKLTGIATGATANSSDSHLLNRQNHTGTQGANTITGLAAVATSGAFNDLSGKPPVYGLATSAAVGMIALGPGMTLDPITNQLYLTRRSEQPKLDEVLKAPNLTLSNFDYTVKGDGTGQGTILGTTGNFAGKWYFEVVFAAGTASPDNAVGVAALDADLAAIPGIVGPGAAIRQTTGVIAVDNSTVTGQAQIFSTVNNVLRVAVDASAGRIWFATGNAPWNGSSSASPAPGAGGLAIARRKLYPFVSVATDATFTVRFGGTMGFTPPAGFAPWATSSQAIRLADLTDVDSSGWASDLVLKYDAASGKWRALPEANYVTQATALVNQATQAAADAQAAKAGVDATVETVDGYAADALASKNAAAASKDAAAISETNAGTSASAAAGSATAAAASKNGADTAKTAAEAARDAAAGSATAANASKVAAAASEAQAMSYRNTSSSYANAAEASATAAATSASNAAASEQTVADSASAAAASASAAAGSATAASGSATTSTTNAAMSGQSARDANDAKVAAEAAVASIGTSVGDAAASASAAATSASEAMSYRNTSSSYASAAEASAAEAATAAEGWEGGLAEAGIPNAKALTGTVDWQTLNKSGLFLLPSIGTNGPPVGTYTGQILVRVEVASNGTRQLTGYLTALGTINAVQIWTTSRVVGSGWTRWECLGNFGFRRVVNPAAGGASLTSDDRGSLFSVTSTGNPTMTLPSLVNCMVGDSYTFYNNAVGADIYVRASGTEYFGIFPDGTSPRINNVSQITLTPGESITFVVNDNRLRWIPLNYSKAPPYVRLPNNAVNLDTLKTPGIYGFWNSSPNHANSVGWPAGLRNESGTIEVLFAGADDVIQRITQPNLSGSKRKPAVFERLAYAGGATAWQYKGPLSNFVDVATADNGPVYVDEVGDYCEWDQASGKYYKRKSYSTRITWVFSTNWTPPAWAKYGRILEMCGAGGGGGSGPPSTSGIAGAGGNGGLAGTFLSKNESFTLVTLTPGVAMPVVIGVGGTGGNDNVNGASGTQGGTTSFGGYSCPGGTGGGRPYGIMPGEMGVRGERGWPAAQANQVGGKGGDGQSSRFGSGGLGGKGGTDAAQPGNGAAAANYSYGAGGGGGGGAVSNVGPARNGGNGSNGIVILEY